jgi:hypothetical protein
LSRTELLGESKSQSASSVELGPSLQRSTNNWNTSYASTGRFGIAARRVATEQMFESWLHVSSTKGRGICSEAGEKTELAPLPLASSEKRVHWYAF